MTRVFQNNVRGVTCFCTSWHVRSFAFFKRTCRALMGPAPSLAPPLSYLQPPPLLSSLFSLRTLSLSLFSLRTLSLSLFLCLSFFFVFFFFSLSLSLSLFSLSISLLSLSIIATAPAQKLIRGFFWPKNISSSYPSSANWGHSPRVFQSESSEHRNEQAQMELGWELAVDSLILRHGFGRGFPRKTARILFRKLAWIWHGFFEPFFPCPKKSTPNPRHPKIPKSTPFSETFFPNGFSGCLTQFA